MNLKASIVLVALFAVGCAPFVPLSELEDEAMHTGDWSAVEEREQSIARRQARQPNDCGSDRVEVCSGPPGVEECRCVQRKTMRKVLPQGM